MTLQVWSGLVYGLWWSASDQVWRISQATTSSWSSLIKQLVRLGSYTHNKIPKTNTKYSRTSWFLMMPENVNVTRKLHLSHKLHDIKPVWMIQSRELHRGDSLRVRDGRKRRAAYMFLSFDPLVCLLNSLQVLKMQLHQPINLGIEWNRGRQRESERCNTQEGKKIGGIWG